MNITQSLAGIFKFLPFSKNEVQIKIKFFNLLTLNARKLQKETINAFEKLIIPLNAESFVLIIRDIIKRVQELHKHGFS